MILIIAMFSIMIFLYVTQSKKKVQDEYIKKNRSLTLAIEGVREEMKNHWELKIFSPKMLRKWAETGQMDKVLSTIPVVSAWRVGQRKAAEGGYKFKVPKFEPRNPKNAPDELEARAIKAIKKDNLKEYYEIDKDNNLRYFRPIRLDSTCLYCHGDPKLSQKFWGNTEGKDPTGGPMENWKDGSIHGAFEVITSMKQADEQVATMAKGAIWIVVLGLIIIMIVFGLIISRNVEQPLIKMTEVAKKLAQGEVEQNIEFESGDEIGQMADSFRETIVYMKDASNLAESISQGNLHVEVEPKSDLDVLNNSLKIMIDNLRTIIVQIQQSSDQVSAGASEISSSSQSLSTGATEQAASLEEINSTMVEISSRSQANDESSRSANQLANKAKSAAETGEEKMQKMMNAMDKISSSSQEISKIIKVIDDIAFQTNLLSLNAAVEAEHVGKLGKGFAVVAGEVRNLANRCSTAANSTAELVENLLSEVKTGNDISVETKETFQEIVDSVMQTASLMEEVALASSEQSHGTKEVSSGLSQIEHVTQSMAANSEETAASSIELSSQANQLRNLLHKFKM
jgi:methyl-accepting chemotaxis protein